MRALLQDAPTRVDPAVIALRRVLTESARLREALEQLDEAGGCGRAVQVAGDDLAIRRAVGPIREARAGLSTLLGRLASLARDGAIG